MRRTGTATIIALSLSLGTTAIVAADGDKTPWQRPGDDEIRRMLSSEQYQVTQRDGTEPAFRNAYWDCINSAALRFIPLQHLEREGYGEYLAHFNASPTK